MNKTETLRVALRDIDFYGHVHNSIYFNYYEDGMTNQLRAYNLLSLLHSPEKGIGYHIKTCSMVFHEALVMDDEITPELVLTRMGNTSISFEVRLYRTHDHVLCAVGSYVFVCVDLHQRNKPTPIPVPQTTRSALLSHFAITPSLT